MGASPQRPVRARPSRARPVQPGDRRLRLVPGVATPILRAIEALEAAHACHHADLLQALGALEAELENGDPVRCRGAHEQISFIRVGMRCLADAIGELDAHLIDIARPSQRRARTRSRQSAGMRLSGVREGDIVRVNDGLSYLAVVRGRRGRRLLVAPLTGRWNPAPVKATDVIAHWRRTGPKGEDGHGGK